MAAQTSINQGQRPPQPSTLVVLAHPHHEARFEGKGINLLKFHLICCNIKSIDLLGNTPKMVRSNFN